MRKQLLMIAVIITSVSAYSQKGNNMIGVGADVAIPVGEFHDRAGAGLGGYAKGLYGIGRSGQLTLTYSYTSFKVKEGIRDAFSDDELSIRIMPVMFGYRHNLNGLYLEPQVGYGIYTAKASMGNISLKESEGAFAWAIAGGFVISKSFDLGASYQSLSKEGESTSWVSVRVGYNFSLKK